jgi:integrase/recombinase XerD
MQEPTAAARRYLDHLTVERGLADNTLAAYRRDLERYLAFLHDRDVDDLNEVDPRLIRAFVASISASTHGPDEESYKATSVARTLSAVRTFHRFALREGLTEDDPTAGVVRPRLPRGLPHPLTVGEVAAVIDAPPAGSPAGVRDRAILELLYGAGLRVSELTGLDVDDVDLEEGAVRVLGKGSKERDVPIGRMARDAIDAYLRTSRPVLATARSRGALFLNARGGRLTRQSWGRPPPRPAACSPSMRAPQGFGEPSPHTTCDTPSRRTCWRGEPTCGSSRSCSVMPASPRRRSTPWSRRNTSARPTTWRTPGHAGTDLE